MPSWRGEEGLIEEVARRLSTGAMERINESIEILKDAVWALEKDILANCEKTIDLAGVTPEFLCPEAVTIYWKINLLLNSLDRIEVRGRDSAGMEISLRSDNAASMDAVIATLKSDGLYDEF